jgi:fructokinase
MASREPVPGKPIVFGEVLFDLFVDGREVLGGAPFNVAWHLQGFGLEPLMISRIGGDEKGEEIRRVMTSWGMDTSGIEVDDLRPTGLVRAIVRDGQPEFRIEPHQAYDRIEGGPARSSGKLESAGLLYHGTLALRSDASWIALRRIRDECGVPVFVDINLRAPWWHPERVRWSLEGARWVKLNNNELRELTLLDCRTEEECARAAQRLAARFSIECVIVTRGERGAILVAGGALRERSEAAPVEDLVDTVGAGDGFSAVAILGLMRGWSEAEILTRATGFAARLCEIQGATSVDPALYRDHRESWREANC